MIAGQPIAKGEKLVNVPRNLWMTSLTAKDSPICGQMVKEHNLDSWKVRRIPAVSRSFQLQGISAHLLCFLRAKQSAQWSIAAL